VPEARGSTIASPINVRARGARLHGRGSVITLPRAAVEAVDTTGAGDCFDAGFIAGRVPAGIRQDCHARRGFLRLSFYRAPATVSPAFRP